MDSNEEENVNWNLLKKVYVKLRKHMPDKRISEKQENAIDEAVHRVIAFGFFHVQPCYNSLPE